MKPPLPDQTAGRSPEKSEADFSVVSGGSHTLVRLILLSILFGLLIGLSPLMTSLNHSDSLLPVHLSIEQPDKFYWGQARFGMLIPKMTHWIQDPWANLFTQQVLSASFSVFGLLALGAMLGLDYGKSVLSGMLLLGFLFGSQSPETLQALFMIAQPYGVSLGLFVLLMLIVRDHTRLLEYDWKHSARKENLWWAASFLAFGYLFHLVFWVNLAMVPFSMILVLLGWPCSGAGKTALRIALVVSGVLMTLFLDHQDSQQFLPAARWGDAVTRHLQNCFLQYFLFRPGWVLVFSALVGVAGIAGFFRNRKEWLKMTLPYFVLALVSLALSVLFSLNHWVSFNLFHARYSSTSLLLLFSSMCFVAVSSLKVSHRTIRVLLLVSCILATVIGLRTFGFPNPRKGELLLLQKAEQNWGFTLEDLDAGNPDFITGDYWFAWTAGFLMNAERARHGRNGRVLVLSGRSHAIAGLVGERVRQIHGPLIVSGKAEESDFTKYLGQVFLRSIRVIDCDHGVRTDELVSTR